MYITKTKKEFEKHFRAEILPIIKAKESEYTNGVDTVMRREAWNDYIDSLVKDRQLPKKAMDWSAPW